MNPKNTYMSNLGTALSSPSSAWQNFGKTLTVNQGSLQKKKVETPVTPSNTSATGTTGTKISSPAGQAYVNNIASPYSSNTPSVPTPSASTPSTPQSAPESEYIKYLKTLFNPEDVKLKQQAYETQAQRLADIQSEQEKQQLESRKVYNKILETGGGLKSGTQQGASAFNRRATDSLADTALRESAAARSAQVALDTLNTYLGAGSSLYEAEQAAEEARQNALGEGFSLSEGQARYDSAGNLIAERGKTYAPSTSSSSGGSGLVGSDGKPLKLLAGQVDTIANYDNTMSAAERALTLLDQGISTGPVANLLLQGKKAAGYGDEDSLKLEQLLGKLRSDFMKAISGAAVSEPEVKRLSKFLPDFGDQENVIKSKLNNLRTELQSSKDTYLKTIGGTSTQPSVSSPQQMQLPDGTVVTLQPDGTYQ